MILTSRYTESTAHAIRYLVAVQDKTLERLQDISDILMFVDLPPEIDDAIAEKIQECMQLLGEPK